VSPALVAFTISIIERVDSGGNVSVFRCLIRNMVATPTKLIDDFRGIPQRNHSQELKFVRCRVLTHPFYFKFITPPTTGIRTVRATVSIIKQATHKQITRLTTRVQLRWV
jgi:hypothetical protein